MIPLIGKELRQLLPIGWLWLAIIALGLGLRVFTERVDEETFASWCEGFCEPGTNAFVAALTILFVMITAYSLFPREHDESTIDFLRALPVPRRSIYLAKVSAAWLLVCAVTLASYALDAALLASNPESLGGRFVGQVWWTLLWRDWVFAFVILAHGVVLSWFRTTGLVLYALYVILLLWYESQSGSAGLLSVFGVLSNDYEGQRLTVDARAILVHVAIALALLVLGYGLWSRTESAAHGGPARPSRARGLLRGTLTTLAFVALAGVALYRVGTGSGAVPDESLGIATTEHYRFVHRPRDRETVDYLVEHAEADLAAIARMLGVEELPLIRVDLSATSDHAAGLAKWKKIRMDLSTFEGDRSQRRVLAHEATHVLQAIESNRALARQFATTRFFVEGMAQHVSFEVVPEPSRRASNHALAAVAKARQDIRFEDLADAAAFAERFDPELYYSLGDLWTLALVDTCGERVLGDFLRAAGREGASGDTFGELFWRDTMRASGCELDTVNSAWARRMDATLETVDERRFPRFDDIVVRRDANAGVVRIDARLRAAEGVTGIVPPVRAVVRVRAEDRLGGGVDPLFRGTMDPDGDAYRVSFAVPGRALPRARFDYQLGYEPSVARAGREPADGGRASGSGGGAAPDGGEGTDEVFPPAVDSRVYYEGWRGGNAGAAP